MKKLMLTLATLTSSLLLFSQTDHVCYITDTIGATGASGGFLLGSPYGPNGRYMTPKDSLRALIIFAGFVQLDGSDYEALEFDPTWPYDEINKPLPSYADNTFFYSAVNAIQTTPSLSNIPNLSNFYYEMSKFQEDGKPFKFVADYFPERIDIMPTEATDNSYAPFDTYASVVYDTINARIARGVTLYSAFNWTKYDNRENITSPTWEIDNSPVNHDDYFDYVIIVWRYTPGFHPTSGNIDGGVGAGGAYADIQNGTINLPGSGTMSINNGFTMGKGLQEVAAARELFIHESAHSFYGCPHYGAQNEVVDNRYYMQYGWGMTPSNVEAFDAALGWDRWFIGWIPDNTFRNIEDDNDNGEYEIGDFITTGDALRIEIPHTNGTQHLWIENHQKLSVFDERHRFTVSNGITLPESPVGLVMYVEALSDTKNEMSDITNGNAVKVLHPDGNYDYTYSGSPTSLTEWFYHLAYNWEDVSENNDNPLVGMNKTQGIRFDYDVNGSITYSSDWNNATGDNETNDFLKYDGSVDLGILLSDITFPVSSELRMGSNPPIVPLRSYNTATTKFDSLYLNGLRIKVVSFNATTKEYTIEVTYDDFHVKNDARWCGNRIKLASNDSLIVDPNYTLTLDMSGTTDRHLPDGTFDFINPTELVLEDDSHTILKSGSTLLVKNNSTLTIESGAELVIETNAKLQIESNAKVVLQPGATLRCSESGAKIIVEDDGLLLMNGNDIELNNTSAILELKAGGTIQTAANVDFTFTGTGYIYYYQNGIFSLGANSKFILHGTGDTDRKMWVGTNALLYIASHDVEVTDCRLDYSSGGTFKVADNDVLFDNIFANDASGYAGHAIHAYNTNDLEVTSCDFDGFNSTILLDDIDVCPNDVNVKIDYSTFVHYNFAAVEAYDVERMRFFTSTATGESAVEAGLFLEDVVECLVENSVIEDHPVNSVDAAGIFAHRVGTLIIDGSSIRDNYEGIEARATNIFVRNAAVIKDNTNGINSISSHNGSSNPDMMYRVTVGDIGCGWIIDNAIGVLGEDILLDIDQLIHANASDSVFKIHPNRFDGNSSNSFEVCYDYFDLDDVSDPIPANHNYWTSGVAPSTGNYEIGANANCNDIDLDASIFYTTEPENCDCIDEDCDEEATIENIALRLSSTSCNYLINKNGGGRISIANQYRDGYKLLINGDYNYAYQKFNWLKNRVDAEYSGGLPEGVCKQMYISSVGLKKIMEIQATVHCQYPFWISDREAVFDELTTSKFLAFPNPAQTIVTLGSLQGLTASYQIFAVSGEIVSSGNLAGSITIDVRNYTKGIYLVVFTDNFGIVIESQKIIIM